MTAGSHFYENNEGNVSFMEQRDFHFNSRGEFVSKKMSKSISKLLKNANSIFKL